MIIGNWKYIFKNLWFVLPFALLPAAFFAFSFDYEALAVLMESLTAGIPVVDFVLLFRAWSIIRFDSWIGAVAGIGVYLSCAIFMTGMLSLVEKHMRIGKRTLNGAFSQLWHHLFSSLAITLLFLFLYELWAGVLSALMYAIGSFITGTAGLVLLSVVAFIACTFVLLYCISTFYLWYPCVQLTGFGPYEALRYSHQLVINVRVKLVFTLFVSFLLLTAGLIAMVVLLSEIVFRVGLFVLFVFVFLSFCIRMETLYFATDRLEREDLKHSYKGVRL